MTRNVVLVHGAWVDGSGWEGVYQLLTRKGFKVSVAPNSNISLSEDVRITNAVLNRQDGPAILVGHSYGGAIITEAGNHPNVAALVYVAAFAPDAGESLQKMLEAGPVDPDSPILPAEDGFLWMDKAKVHRRFCQDVSAEQAAFMADSQVPAGVAAFTTELTIAAWRSKKSWYIVAQQDRMIPPDAERQMAKRAGAKVTEIDASHVVFISHPAEVTAVIEEAANATK